MQNAGNPDNVFITKFTPYDPEMAYRTVQGNSGFLSNDGVRSVIRANNFTRKRTNN